VRDIIGLLGWHRLFRAVRHIEQKWKTCTPGMLSLQGLMDPTVSWGTLGTHLAAAKGARGARAEGFSSSSPPVLLLPPYPV
jgi:hypothetical protein